ncbi:MAG: carboxypeptidase regulatory-like domain-containing protein [Terracidiphilus sp.]|nr:carboxypeptidase regulatory-like domain-containing protein [Terracidiphilus sp.]
MAEATRNWKTWLVAGALSLGACAGVCAQTALVDTAPLKGIQIQAPLSGSLAGRLTDLHSAPLAGVSVVLHNQATGAEVRLVTAKNGSFRIAEIEAGEYTLEADEPQLGHGRLEGILVTGGAEARLQAAMDFEAAAPEFRPAGLVEAAATPSEFAPPPRMAVAKPLTAYATPGAAKPAEAGATAPSSTVAPAAVRFVVAATELTQSAPVSPALQQRVLEKRVSDSRVPGPAPTLLLATVSRGALSTTSPEMVALVGTEPMRRLRLVPREAAAVHLPSELTAPQARALLPVTPKPEAPQPVILQPAAGRAEGLTAPANLPLPQLRAVLETQSTPFAPTLAVMLPRTLPLTHSVAPALLPLSMAVASGIKAALLLGQTAFTPVAAAAQRDDPTTAVVATTVTATQLESLPSGGRRWQEFLLDTPAVSTGADGTQASYRGSQESAEITIDGASTTLKFGTAAGSGSGSAALDPAGQGANQPSAMRQAWTGRLGLGVSESAIREVTAVSGNVEAEGMRSAGGRTSINTERGGDTLHGQGFYFDRQNTWGARNPFTQWVQNTGTTATPNFAAAPYTPPDHEAAWGLGMGSRIRRNKLFWFGAIDCNRRNDPGVAMVKNPSEFFNLPEPTSAAVTLLSAQLGESANQAYNDYLGVSGNGATSAGGSAGGAAGLEQLAGLLGPGARTASQWVGFARIDWQAAEHHHFSLEGIGADRNAAGGGLTRVTENYGSHSFGSSHASQQWLLARWEAYLTPNLLAVTQGSAGRTILSARPDTPSAFEKTLLNGNFWGQLPQITVDSRYGFTLGNPSRFGQGSYPDEKLYHAQEMVDWVHNKVLIRAGFELDHNSDATSLLRNQTGTYSYSTVASFISDALAFERFGFAGALDPRNPHNCGTSNTKFGSQPCYSHYSQTVGPTNWHLSTNDWAGYATAQWQAGKFAVFSGGLRWELEQMPPPITALANSEIPLTEKLPSLGNNWGPRVSVALGGGKRWPVLRLGYGMYYGRTENATLETALTQTGSLKGDLSFFMRPQDDCQHCSGGAPPFPYVFAGQPASVVKPGAVEFAPTFRNPEVHQALAAIEQPLPLGIKLTAGAMLSLGRRLPVSVDTNFSSAVNPGTITYNVKDLTGTGPIKSTQITVPFYATWPSPTSPTGTAGRLNANYQQISEIMSRSNSTYEALMVRISRESRRGLSLHAHYTYAHAMDWNPNNTTLVAGSDVLDPANFSAEYGTSNLDVRHTAAAMVIFDTPWRLRGMAGRFGNGWMMSGIGQFRSGLPYTMRTSGSLPEEFTNTGATIVGLGPGMNGSGGDNRVYGLGNDNIAYNIGRNTFRYPNVWKADMRLGKKFDLGETRQLEVLVESFNLFNHRNVTELETTGYSIESGGASGTLPTLCYLTINTNGYAGCGTTANSGTGTPIGAFGQSLNVNATNFYRERQIQIGVRVRF